MFDDLTGHDGDYLLIDGQQVIAAHPRFAGTAAGNNNKVRPSRIGIVIRADDLGVIVDYWRCLQDVERFPLRQPLDDVYEHDVRIVALCQATGTRSANLTRANDCYFLPHSWNSSITDLTYSCQFEITFAR